MENIIRIFRNMLRLPPGRTHFLVNARHVQPLDTK